MREDSVHYAGMMGIKQYIENCSKPLGQTLELPEAMLCTDSWSHVLAFTPHSSPISADEREGHQGHLQQV